MNSPPNTSQRRERLIAGLLSYGTWVASAVIAAGVLLGFLGHPGLTVEKAGIGLFILLPVARVALMLVTFLRERDYAYAAISALVLVIIAAGVVAGL
jgi:uncharacterized membrane protein